jgi:hypothetical protein
MASALDALIAAGMPRKDAASFIVQKSQELRLRTARSGLTPNQVLGWRDEMGARAPKLAEKIYRGHVDRRRKRLPLERTDKAREEARRFAIGCLLGARAAGF